MPKLIIQVNGETVRKVEGKLPHLVEIKSSEGLLGEFHPEGQARVNIVYTEESEQEFSLHIDEINEAPVEEEAVEEVEEEEEAKPKEATDFGGGFSLPTE